MTKKKKRRFILFLEMILKKVFYLLGFSMAFASLVVVLFAVYIAKNRVRKRKTNIKNERRVKASLISN